MVYEELKRLNLNTRDLRIDYLRRNRLIDDDGKPMRRDAAVKPDLPGADTPSERKATAADGRTSDAVDDLLRGIPGISRDERPAGVGAEHDEDEPAFETTRADGMGIAASSSQGITEIRLSGHLDSASSAGLERRLRELIAAGAVKIIVDLAEVSYVSSGGWGIFVGEVRALRERGGDIVLTGMTPEVYDVYELLGFADVLRAFPTVGDARGFLNLPPEERSAQPLTSPDLNPDEVAAAHGIRFDGADDAPREWQSLRVEATTVGADGEVAVLSLGGIIDTVSAEKLRASVDQIISAGRYKLVVDMSQVEYVSSGGWGVFTERLREVRRAGGDIKLFGMDPDVYYVFTMLGFNIVLSSFDILADAILDFERPAPATDGEAQDDPAIPAPSELRAQAPPGRVSSSVPGMDIVWETGPEGVRIAHLSGIIETTAVSLLSDEIAREVAVAPRGIVFDLSRVEYVSSSGWGQFAHAHQAVGAVALAGLSPDLFEVYECLEFRNFIDAFNSDAEAVASLAGGDYATPGVPQPPLSGDGTFEAMVDPPAESHLDGVDDVLVPREDRTPPAEPKAPEAEAPVVKPARPDAAPAPDEAEDEPVWGRRRMDSSSQPPSKLDVSSARADENRNRDQNLRSMGWNQYGEQLKKRAGQKGADTADDADSGDGDGAAETDRDGDDAS
jgi:anti-anti-sigma factor